MRWLICETFLMRDELTMRRARRSGKRKDRKEVNVRFNASQTTSELSVVADADADADADAIYCIKHRTLFSTQIALRGSIRGSLFKTSTR
jgi:hypothetical protein